jgi:predicted amidohydrolase
MKNILRISLVQFEVIWEDPAANRKKLNDLLKPLVGNTDLILLPEMFTTGFSMHAKELAESMDGDTITWMKEYAGYTGAALAGSLIVRDQERYYNRLVFVLPTGEISCYDKKHLFAIGGEDQYYSHGNNRVVVNYCGWRIALFICYDLRFPVWCRSVKDADLMLFSANWPASRLHVWQTLTRARAIENQLYVAGVNRTGTDGAGVAYPGESVVVDPKGRIICELNGESDVVATSELSLDELNRFRKKFPVSGDADGFEILR